jgi:hypothetical protein
MMPTRERNEVPWWLVSGTGVALVFTAIIAHVVWGERMSEHFTMEVMAFGGLMAGTKTAKDVTGKVLKDRRLRRDTAEHRNPS